MRQLKMSGEKKLLCGEKSGEEKLLCRMKKLTDASL